MNSSNNNIVQTGVITSNKKLKIMNWNSDWTKNFPVTLGIGISLGILIGVLLCINLFQLY